MPRAFGTDTLNSANPLTKPAPLMAVPATAPSGLASMSRRTGRRAPSGLSNRLLAVDESKARDRSWLYEDSTTTPSPTESSDSRPRFAGAPICNNFVRDGYCAYGESCGFDHPAPQPTVPARRISVPVIPTVRRSSDAFLVGPAAPAPSTARSGSGVGRGRDLSPAPIGFAQARRERSMGRVHDISRSRDSRRPSLVATQSAPAVVPAHPDAPPAVPVLAPMFYATYRRGSNGEVLDPSLIPHAVQAQKSLYYRTKPCRYWSAEGSCPKGDKCTFIHDPALAGVGGSKPEFEGIKTVPASPREVSPVRVSQEQVAEEEAPKAVKAQRPPRLPLVSPTKVREPHPAWRVVGGGVTLAAAAAAASEDQMDEDAVEQALLADEQKPFTSPVQAAPAPSYGFPSPSPSGSRSSFSSPVTPQPVPVVPQAHNGFPAYALPTHPVFHAYAYPGPVPYSEPQPQPVFVQQPAYGVPPGWSLVMVPPPSAQPQPQQQQQQPQHIAYYPAPSPAPCATAPAPVLYGATETSYTYGYPQSGETIHALAGAGVDVSALDGSERPFVLDSNLGDAYDEYGIVAHPEDDEDDIEVSVGSMPMINMTAAAPCAPGKPWGFARKLSSWADEVEAADPDLSGVHSNGDEMMQVDNSWPQCSTTPNSPRANRRLFQAEA